MGHVFGLGGRGVSHGVERCSQKAAADLHQSYRHQSVLKQEGSGFFNVYLNDIKVNKLGL